MAATTSPSIAEGSAAVAPVTDDRQAPIAHKKRPALLWLLLPAAALAALGTWRFTSTSASPPATTPTQTRQVVTASTGSMSNTVSAQGTVAAEQTDDLNFEVSGEVTAVNVAAGDEVTAGQVLATIDSAELASALSTAQSNLADALATLSNDYSAGASYAQITADQAKVTTATDAVATAEANLVSASLIATFDGTVSSVNLTVGEQLGSDGTGATAATGSASGSGQSSSPLGSSSNASPTGNNRAATGATSATTSTSTSSAQIVVVSGGRYKVTLQVSSADVGQVAAGQSVSLSATSSTSSSNAGGLPGGFGGGGFPGGGAFPGGGFPGGGAIGGNGNGGNGTNGQGAGTGGGRTARSAATATGTVTEVGRVASASSGVATYPVTVTFAADPAQFFVGGSVTAQITTTKIDDVVQVPAQAVTTNNDGSTVQRSTDGTSERTETVTVTTGITANGMVQITSGLDAGDKVVVTQFRPPGLTGGQAPTQNPTGGAGQTPAGGRTGAPGS